MTSFLRNSWYCAGWSGDLGEKPIGIRICDEPIVLFRTEGGSVAALEGRCPHRFAPLSIGRVRGDVIECGYHGLQFDRTGTCTKNPHGSGTVPPRAHIRAYPVAERHGAIWVWMGDPAAADPETIMDLYFVEAEGLAGTTGYLKINADYQLVIDNLLDLTHGTYLHLDTVGASPEDSLGSSLHYDFRTEGSTVYSDYTFYNSAPTPLMAHFYKEARGDMRASMRWDPASSLLLDIGITPVGQPPENGLLIPSAHLIVPETANSCHYFFAISRNWELENSDKTRIMGEIAMKAFAEEDEPVIAQCFEMMGRRPLFDLSPAILETDIAAVQARRILSKLIRQEGGEAGEAQVAAE